MKFEQYVVKEIVHESEEVRTFRLAKQEGSVPDYKPGHFFLLRLPGEDGKPCQRSYSAASHPSEPLLSFCIKLKGSFTHLLWNLKEGDSLEVDGPYGTFLLLPDDSERVFIGGGVGISGLRSQILETVNEGRVCSLFDSGHGFGNLTYFNEMKKLSEEHDGFKFFPSITGDDPPPGWDGLAGRINVQILQEKLGSLAGKAFYLCGSKEMAGELAAALIAAGVPREKVKKDEWG